MRSSFLQPAAARAASLGVRLFVLLALIAPATTAAERVLLGLADLHGLDTFRSVRKDQADASYHDLTAQGLRAGLLQERDPATGQLRTTGEVRAVFKPTIYDPERRLRRSRVSAVSVLLGGGEAALTKVDRFWAGGTTAAEIFELPTSPLTDADLVGMFQTVLDSAGRSELTSGIMIRSTRPLSDHDAFSARFSVVVQEETPWRITGRIRQLQQGQVVEFRSSRRGLATFTVNGVEQYVDVPVARDTSYRFSIDPAALQSGANALLIRITDPEDGSFQEFSLTLTA